MAALQTHRHSEHQDALGETLALVAGRVRTQRRIRGGVRGLAAALAVDILPAALSRADVLPDVSTVYTLLVVLPVAGASLGGWLASRSPITPMDAARLAEARLPLKERLSSALEFHGVSRPGPLLALQHADADAHARALDTRLAAPRRFPREAWLIVPLLAALALILWLPRLPFAPTPAQRAERDVVRSAGHRLAQAAHQAARQAAARHDAGAMHQAQKVEVLGKRMAQGRMDRAQALAAVSQQEQQLAQLGSPASPNPGDPGQAAKDLTGSSPSSATSNTQSSASRPAVSNWSAAPQAQGSPAGQAGARTPAEAAKQAASQAAPRKPSGPAAYPAVQHPAANASPRDGSPNTQKTTPGTASGRQPSRASSAGDPARRAAEATRDAHQSSPASSGPPEARQALENARRQLAGSASSGESPLSKPAAPNPPTPSPASTKPGGAPQPGTSAAPGSAASPGAGKPSGQGKPGKLTAGGQGKMGDGRLGGQDKPGGSRPNGQSQGNGGRPNGPHSPAGKGQGGRPGQDKSTSQSLGNPGGAPGSPAPGGGAGWAAKVPFRSVLPPTPPSKSREISLGAPGRDGAPGKFLPRQSGQPAASAGPSRVPYVQALPRYRKSAEAALNQEQVPPSQRAIVRGYFNSLQPAK